MASDEKIDLTKSPPGKRKCISKEEKETAWLVDDDSDDDFANLILPAGEVASVKGTSSDDEMPDLLLPSGEIAGPSAGVTSPTLPPPKKELTVLSWNIDGLEDRARQTRVYGVFEFINVLSPDVIVLQEVVDENLNVLKQLCSTKYDFTVHKLAPYYNIILVKKCAEISKKKHRVVDFQTGMGRYLLVQELAVKGIPFSVLTTHLESCANSAALRKKQLQLCFDVIKESTSRSNVIFSGDLNIREAELKALGGLPSGVADAWEACGSESEKRFTWDLRLNDNKSMGEAKPRARYDRMYFSLKDAGNIKCSNFDLVGTQRIKSNGLFPSDHFGMFVKFSLPG